MAMHLTERPTAFAVNVAQETLSEIDVSEVSDGSAPELSGGSDVSEVSSDDSNPEHASSEVDAPVQAVQRATTPLALAALAAGVPIGARLRSNALNKNGVPKKRVLDSVETHAKRARLGTPAIGLHAQASDDLASRALEAFSDPSLEEHFTGRDCEFKIFNNVGHAHRDIIEFSARARGNTHAYIYRHKQDEMRAENASRFVGTVPRSTSSIPVLEELAKHIRDTTGDTPNHCILTRYRDIGDGIGAHHDKCLDLASGSKFYVFSFGGERRFFVVHPYLKDVRYHTLTTNGSLLSVDWEANKLYKHGIDEAGCSALQKAQVRYSVVFRTSKRLVGLDAPHAISDAMSGE